MSLTGVVLVVGAFVALVLVDVVMARSATARWERTVATTGDGVRRQGAAAATSRHQGSRRVDGAVAGPAGRPADPGPSALAGVA